jgi:hypothetical protein
MRGSLVARLRGGLVGRMGGMTVRCAGRGRDGGGLEGVGRGRFLDTGFCS